MFVEKEEQRVNPVKCVWLEDGYVVKEVQKGTSRRSIINSTLNLHPIVLLQLM